VSVATSGAALASLGLLTGCVLTGCGIDSAVNDAAGDLIGSGVESALGRVAAEQLRDAGVSVDGTPDCTASVDLSAGSVSGSCLGRTTSSQAVDAVFEGTVDRGACSVLLVVSVDGEEVSRTDTAVPCQFA
jgi:hypothetical protein